MTMINDILIRYKFDDERRSGSTGNGIGAGTGTGIGNGEGIGDRTGIGNGSGNGSNISLRREFEKVRDLLENRINEKNISVAISGDVQISAGADLISVIVQNLFDNAVKYNKQNGSINIDISIDEDTNKPAFIVSDTGTGIEARHLDRIFERFYMADKSRSKKAGGTGLGLAIVKHAVTNLGGEISVQSTPGEGSRFKVII